MYIITSFVIPVSFIVLMALLGGLAETQSLTSQLVSIGWECCILAWGLVAGVFSNSKFGGFSEQPVVVGEMVCVILVLLASLLLAYLRRAPRIGLYALLSLAIGGFALMVPATIAYELRM
jgi:hypothetical protein